MLADARVLEIYPYLPGIFESGAVFFEKESLKVCNIC
jgi:hypothetical protein